MDDHKRCSKCGVEKPRDRKHFTTDKRRSDGLRSQCRSCEAKYRAANKEGIAERARKYYEAHKEHLAKYQRDHREDNKERIAERKRKYYEANKGHILERVRSYREANPDKVRASNRRYRATPAGREAHRASNHRYLATPEGREVRRESKRRYRAEHLEAGRVHGARRRALKHNALPPWETSANLTDFEATRWAAAGFLGVSESALQLGHIVPLKGYGYIDGKRQHVVCGLHTVANLEWQTVEENLSQGSKLDESLLSSTPCVDWDVHMDSGHVLRIRHTND